MAAISARDYFKYGQQRIQQCQYPSDDSCVCRMGNHLTEDYRIVHRHKCTACQEMALFFDTNTDLLGQHSYDLTPVKSSLEPGVHKWLTINVSRYHKPSPEHTQTPSTTMWDELLHQVPTIHTCQPDIRHRMQQKRLPSVQAAVAVATEVYRQLHSDVTVVNAGSCHDYVALAVNHPLPLTPVVVTVDNAMALLRQLAAITTKLQPYQFCHNSCGLDGYVMHGDQLLPWRLDRASVIIGDHHVSTLSSQHCIEDWGKHIELKQQCWYGGNQCNASGLVTSVKLSHTGVKMWHYYRRAGLPMLPCIPELYTTVAAIIAAVDTPTTAMRKLWLSMWEPGTAPDIVNAVNYTQFYQLAGYHLRCDIAGLLAAFTQEQ